MRHARSKIKIVFSSCSFITKWPEWRTLSNDPAKKKLTVALKDYFHLPIKIYSFAEKSKNDYLLAKTTQSKVRLLTNFHVKVKVKKLDVFFQNNRLRRDENFQISSFSARNPRDKVKFSKTIENNCVCKRRWMGSFMLSSSFRSHPREYTRARGLSLCED